MTNRSQLWKRTIRTETGTSFGSLVRAEAAMIYDKVVYLDRANGIDGQSGDDWRNSVQTINGAMDAIYGGVNSVARGRHFAVIYRGRTTSGLAFTTEQVIDIEGVHLIGAGQWYGHGGGHDSCFVASDPTGFTDGCCLLVSVGGCLVSGIKWYDPDDTGASHPYIRATDPIGFAAVNNVFIGSNNNGDVTGRHTDALDLRGAEGFYFSGNEYYYIENPITLEAGAVRYTHKGIIENEVGFGCYRGLYFKDAYGIENLAQRCRWLPRQNYGFVLTYGFDLASGNPSGNTFIENYVGHATKGNAYAKGSGTNWWLNNYFNTNTLYDGT